MNKNTKYIGKTSPNFEFLKMVETAFSDSQACSSQREKKYSGVSQSKTLELIYDSDRPGTLLPELKNESSFFLKELNVFKAWLEDSYGPGYFARCIAALLPPGKRIAPHIDPGFGFAIPRRFHWIVSTNQHAHITIGNQTLNLKQWELWEINNKEIHSAENLGKTNRIHVIFDYVCNNDKLFHYFSKADLAHKELSELKYWFAKNV